MSSPPKNMREFEKFSIGGLLATEVAAVLAILSLSPLSLPLKIAVICFSFSIPVLAVFMLKDVFLVSSATPRIPLWAGFLFGLSLKSGLVGIAALFFHLWWVAGAIYSIMMLVVWWLLAFHTDGNTVWDDQTAETKNTKG